METLTITTVVGGGNRLQAPCHPLEFRLRRPSGVDVDVDGRLYIADSSGGAVHRLDLDGTLRTLAGADAGFVQPTDVAVDGTGSVVVADRENHAIRRIATDGSVTIVGGGNGPGYTGDGGPAVRAQLSRPRGVALGPDGTVYVTDRDNNAVRSIDPEGRITTVLGGSAAGPRLGRPRGLALDADGRLYVADRNHHVVLRVDLRGGGPVEVVAGGGGRGDAGDGGPAHLAQLCYPSGVVLGPDGRVFISDHLNHRIRVVEPAGTIRTVAGCGEAGYDGDGGPPGLARIDYPSGMAVDARGTLYIADRENHVVRRISADVGSGGRPPRPPAPGRRRVPTLSTRFRAPPPTPGSGGPRRDCSVVVGHPTKLPGEVVWAAEALRHPCGVEVLSDGAVVVADANQHRVLLVDDAGVRVLAGGRGLGFSGDGGPADAASLAHPTAVAVGDGSVFVADRENDAVRCVDAAGMICTVAGGNGRGASGWGGPARSAQLDRPRGLAVDRDGTLLISDRGNHAVHRVGADGALNTVAGDGRPGRTGDGGPAALARLRGPQGLAVDAAGGVLVADANNHAVRRIAPDGRIETVAGGNGAGAAGDGGPARLAQLHHPSDVAVLPDGSIVIADLHNRGVRVVDPDGHISTLPLPHGVRLERPAGIAVDLDGAVLVADRDRDLIRRLPPPS